jgi:hypothetical protein
MSRKAGVVSEAGCKVWHAHGKMVEAQIQPRKGEVKRMRLWRRRAERALRGSGCYPGCHPGLSSLDLLGSWGSAWLFKIFHISDSYSFGDYLTRRLGAAIIEKTSGDGYSPNRRSTAESPWSVALPGDWIIEIIKWK